jgi:uncharacterized protein
MTAENLASAIYHGYVRHRRFGARKRIFTYKVFMVYLDLQELNQVFAQSRYWSNKHFGLAWLRKKDFLNGSEQPLYDSIADIVEQHQGKRPTGPIRMLTNLRYFGFIINPITCYYCFDNSGEQLQTVVAEVTNTPWRQRCHYVLDVSPTEPSKKYNRQQLDFAKVMYVSPFQTMDLVYRWRGKKPANRLLVHVDVLQKEQRIFDASLVLSRVPMDKKNMNYYIMRYPWMTLKVFAAIYWQAVILWLKKFTYYPNTTIGNSTTENVDKSNLSATKNKL